MEQKERLTKAMLSMIRSYQKGDEKACYREFFTLEADDRRLVEETFRQARSQYPTRAARKDAKGIYKLIWKNHSKEVTLMTDSLRRLLLQWIFGSKETFFDHYKALSSFEQEAFLDALETVIGESDYEEFRQAAIDIPAFLRMKSP